MFFPPSLFLKEIEKSGPRREAGPTVRYRRLKSFLPDLPIAPSMAGVGPGPAPVLAAVRPAALPSGPG